MWRKRKKRTKQPLMVRVAHYSLMGLVASLILPTVINVTESNADLVDQVVINHQTDMKAGGSRA